MKFSDTQLPTNRKFGFFFTAVFLLVGIYFLYIQNNTYASMSILGAIVFLAITLINADLLLPFNKLWMRFGLLLGMIVSPIIMGVIFFGLITPYGVVMRIMGRDELRLKKTKNKTYWINFSQSSHQTNFKQQF